MPEERPISFGPQGGVAGLEPERGNEPAPAAVQESTAPDTASAASPSPAAEPTQIPEQQPAESREDYEKRFKDSQRALSEAQREKERLQAQLEYASRERNQPQQRTQQDIEAEIQTLEEEVRNDPAKMVNHVYRMMALRDQHWQNQMFAMQDNMERRVVEADPKYKEAQAALDAVKDIPEFQILSPRAQLEVVSRLKSVNGSGQRPAPQAPGLPGGTRRAVAPVQKEPTAEERFRPFLIASGAIKTTPTGSLGVRFERK